MMSVQVEEMYRRMVFNLVCDNKDDHAKNFSSTTAIREKIS